METKSEIRRRILGQRNGLCREAVIEKSARIFKRLCGLNRYKSANTVMAYMDYRNEVMTVEFIQQCIREGKRVVLPKTEAVFTDDTCIASAGEHSKQLCANVIAAYEVCNVNTDIRPGFKGIPEPDSSVSRRIDPKEIDLAVVPGVAFDYGGRRIGYGAGFYDRFLCCLRPDCTKAGVAYCIQMVESIPAGKYDIPMDLVVTEEGIYPLEEIF